MIALRCLVTSDVERSLLARSGHTPNRWLQL